MAEIITLALVSGGPAVHVTVDYEAAGVSPEDISWTLDANLSAISVTADSSGFNFAAPSGMVPAPTGATPAPQVMGNATALDTSNGAVGVLAVVVTLAPLTFSSP